VELVLKGNEGIVTVLGELDSSQHSSRYIRTDLGGLAEKSANEKTGLAIASYTIPLCE